MNPGETAFTRLPTGPRSVGHVHVNCIRLLLRCLQAPDKVPGPGEPGTRRTGSMREAAQVF